MISTRGCMWWRLGPELWAEGAGGEAGWQLGKVEPELRLMVSTVHVRSDFLYYFFNQG